MPFIENESSPGKRVDVIFIITKIFILNLDYKKKKYYE